MTGVFPIGFPKADRSSTILRRSAGADSGWHTGPGLEFSSKFLGKRSFTFFGEHGLLNALG